MYGGYLVFEVRMQVLHVIVHHSNVDVSRFDFMKCLCRPCTYRVEMRMKFTDMLIRKDIRFSIATEEQTGNFYLSIPVADVRL